MEEDHTEIIETPAPGSARHVEEVHTTPTGRVTEVDTTAPGGRVTEVNTTSRPRSYVDQREAVAYDVYAARRLAAYRVTQMIYWIFGLIDGLILIRFVLKALGANPSAGFAEFIYGITAVLVAPFYGLFRNPQTQSNVLELNSIVALIVYALLAWLLAKLAWILVGDTRSAIKTHTSSIDSRL
jgi:uncharacterized membrane protein